MALDNRSPLPSVTGRQSSRRPSRVRPTFARGGPPPAWHSWPARLFRPGIRLRAKCHPGVGPLSSNVRPQSREAPCLVAIRSPHCWICSHFEDRPQSQASSPSHVTLETLRTSSTADAKGPSEVRRWSPAVHECCLRSPLRCGRWTVVLIALSLSAWQSKVEAVPASAAHASGRRRKAFAQGPPLAVASRASGVSPASRAPATASPRVRPNQTLPSGRARHGTWPAHRLYHRCGPGD